MEAFIVFASAICALIGVGIGRLGDASLDHELREVDQQSKARKKMGKALGHE